MGRMVVAARERRKPPLFIEIAGLAGAGKTTLARMLSQKHEDFPIGAEIELRKNEHLPAFIRNSASLLPFLLRPCRSSRWFTWEELKYMIYLKGWPQVLRQQAAGMDTAVLLDHGPVFKLATLDEFGPERLKSQAFERWWQDMYALWAFTLDMVVWLEAPEPVLITRINQRDQRHVIKGKPRPAASSFLERYRMAYERILARLSAYRKPVFLHFDTSRVPIEQIAEEVLAACGRELAGVGLFEKVEIEA